MAPIRIGGSDLSDPEVDNRSSDIKSVLMSVVIEPMEKSFCLKIVVVIEKSLRVRGSESGRGDLQNGSY